MKKQLMIVLLFGLLAVYACKGKKTETETTTPDAPATTEPVTKANPGNTQSPAPGSYTVTATPDTARLGKNQEAFIRLTDLKAISLTDPDGHATGTELTYKVEVTNKSAIGGSRIYISTANFRLELDNGTKISPNSTSVSVEPDATNTSDEDKFTLPPGTKPTMLNLFFDETRASIKIEMK